MKTLIKHISVGKYEFNVGIDRAITVDVFEHFPELMEYLLENQSAGDENKIVINAIKDKTLGKLLESTDKIKDLVKYAFPFILAKADKEQADKADEIIDYIYENEVEDEFSNAVFEFICLGFTEGTSDKKPKVKFTMK
jgi:hypothetical protein